MHVVIVFDNDSYLSSSKMSKFSLDKGIIFRYSANYYHQGNGVAKSTNKNLIRILKKTVVESQRHWHKKVSFSLLEDRLTPNISLGNYPFYLVNGKEEILPSNLYFLALYLFQAIQDDPSSAMQNIINTLLLLEEEREKEKRK
jgi:hypothetical protein